MESFSRIRTVKFSNGETFPMMMRMEDNRPVFSVTVYLLTMVRLDGRQASTVEKAARNIKWLHDWLAKEGIDVKKRVREGQILDMHDIDKLVEASHDRAEDLLDDPLDRIFTGKRRSVLNLERYRKASPKHTKIFVSVGTAVNRLRTSRDYLDWFVLTTLHTLNPASDAYRVLENSRQHMKDLITTRIPKHKSIISKKGLEPDKLDLLLKAIDPASPLNPWKSPFVRVRNQLYIKSLLALGHRRGENLGIYVLDVKLAERTVDIHRRPDNPEDPRLHKPAAKTLPRTLPTEDELTSLEQDYITKWRSKIPAARRHRFLYVSRKGPPLSISAANKIFEDLRKKVPGLPKNLAAHMMRRTWNEKFSEAVDTKIEQLMKRKTTDVNMTAIREEEENARRYAQGWKAGSKMAEIYSRRYVQRKAFEATLKLQADMFKKQKEDQDSDTDK